MPCTLTFPCKADTAGAAGHQGGAALHQLSRILARELVSQHINVNVIAPGRFPSKMTQHIGNDEQALAENTALIPMKRWGREHRRGLHAREYHSPGWWV